MIGRLRGTLASKQPPWLLIDVGGVGYELQVPMSTLYELPELGQEVTLCTHYAQKEDSVSLYGFATERERQLFRTVQKVSGIGAKIALAVLSGMAVDQFALNIQAGDVAALTKIPGIGKKTAERMVLELRDATADLTGGTGQVIANQAANSAASEAVLALQQLGYKAAEAEKLAKQVFEEGDSAEVVIRKALKAALK